MAPKPVFLDVDSTIVEKNLRITTDSEDIDQMFQREEQYPSKLIKPIPGFCVKTKEVGTDRKLFINICQTDALPPPDDISEAELARICDSDDICNFRIPLSIGEVRSESDKKGSEAKAVDIAINTQFYVKTENSLLFRNFLLTVVFDGLRDKHDLHTTDERVVLKNKRAYGTLQLHRIQQREIDSVRNRGSEISITTTTKPIIEVLSSTDRSHERPDYRLFKKRGEGDVCYAELRLPNASNSIDFCLKVGEDRMVFDSKAFGYLLDIYLPITIDSERASASFNAQSKILTVKMSLQTKI